VTGDLDRGTEHFEELFMLEYHVAYYEIEDGWYLAKVLDFPGAVSQGRSLKSAHLMIRDALKGLGDFVVEKGEALPRPNPRAKDAAAVFL
jgi:predicted RNase H-like HicB family nuclease